MICSFIIFELTHHQIRNNKLVALKTCQIIYNKSHQYYAFIDGVVYPKSVPLYQNKSINFDCLNLHSRDKRVKTILFWNTYFHSNHTEGKIEPLKKMNCPVVNCEITMNRSLLNESDYVVVHMMPNHDPIDPIPSFRAPNQRWIFFLYEPPGYFAHHNYSVYNSVFNLTATYRLNSHIYTAYYSTARMKWAQNFTFKDDWDYSKGKSKMAFAVISNCNCDSTNRLKYIERVRRYIKVDVFGRCGKPCPDNDCKASLATEYRFLFAFENSRCQDYITEKFFQALHYDVIPVVMGSGPYDHYVSILSVCEFHSID